MAPRQSRTPARGLDCGTATRAGLTLIEMLVATTVTLILMAAIGQVFSTFGRSVSGSRTALDMNSRMRTAAWRLRQDLSGATAPTLPPLDPADGAGYFEVIEGPLHDADAANGSSALAADIDDVLLFTTRTQGPPFRGAFAGSSIESNVAEVAWLARPTVPATTPATYTLYRKQMLVIGYVGAGPFSAAGAGNQVPYSSLASSWRTIYDTYDLSVSRRRTLGPPVVDMIVPNTLADLTKREYRFMHNYLGDTTGLPVGGGGQFPYAFASGNHMAASTSLTQENLPPALEGLVFDAMSTRFGEDVVLTNVIAFDVRVFDPAAPLANNLSGSDVVAPLDENSPPGPAFPPGPVQANGVYVDLGNAVTTAGPSGVTPRFYGTGSPLSRLNGSPCVYDTWSTHYEADGVDQDAVGGTDQGTNGADDQVPARLGVSLIPADGVIDDVDEWETKPPYPYPLRGIEVRIRCFEPSSRQVRQVTVRHTFVPH